MSSSSSTRRRFVGGNWKSNGLKDSVSSLVDKLNGFKVPADTDVVVAPISLHVTSVMSALKSPWSVAVQNVSATSTGAYTGEVAAEQVEDLGIRWVIVGHSERRQLFGETDEAVGKKIAACQKRSLSVIACIGETLSERKENKTLDVVFRQMKAIAESVKDWSRIVIAYEPVWAIGTGVNATPEQAQEVHAALRAWLSKTVSSEVAQSTRIIYGGSVKGSNAAELSSKPDIDGFLVGGASLIPADFQAIISSHQQKNSSL